GPRRLRPIQEQLRLPRRFCREAYAERIDEILRLHPIVEECRGPVVPGPTKVLVERRVRTDSSDGLHRVDPPRVVAEILVDVALHIRRLDSLYRQPLDTPPGKVSDVETGRDRPVAARHRAYRLRPQGRVDGGGISEINDVVGRAHAAEARLEL